MKHYRECFNELKNAEESSGLLAAQYKFWMAECRYREAEDAQKNEGLYQVAAQLYAEVPKSDRLVAANISEAMAYARLEDWPKVVELLQPATSPFQKFVSSSPKSSLSSQGRLILAEALLRQNLYADATNILSQLSVLDLADQDNWRHQMLLSHGLIAQKKNIEALNVLQELLNTSENRMPRLRAAQAIELKFLAHRELRQFAEALDMCQRLWQEEMPGPIRRRGLLLALNLTVSHGAPLDLSDFTKLSKTLLKGDDLAVAQIALGEFHLCKDQKKRTLENMVMQIQQPTKAREQFRLAIGSSFSGYARIGLAWDYWQKKRYGESHTNYIQAANILLEGEERNRSQFKAIESAFLSGDMQSTLHIGRNYMTNSPPAILRDSAGFLMARAAIRKATDESNSLDEARKLVFTLGQTRNPGQKERATLLLARAESRNNNPKKARELLSQLSTNTSLKSIIELEAAHTFIREKKWPDAIIYYENWLKKHVKASGEQRAKITFDLGWLQSLNKNLDKAIENFTKIVEQYPDTSEAARAQIWMADHLFNLGVEPENYVRAEEAYQKVRDNKRCPVDLKFRASLMAGRSALARGSFNNARDYFSYIIKAEECPAKIRMEAVFALSDTAILDPAEGESKFEEAISILDTILKSGDKPSSQILLQIHGRIGDCHLQMAAEDPNRYLKARNAYSRVLGLSNHMNGDPPARFRAMLGMAQSLKNMPEENTERRKDNLIKALGWSKKVFEGATATATELDPFWIRQSGLLSAELQILAGKSEEAISTYEILGLHFNKMKPSLDARINQIQQQLRESNQIISGEK